MSNPITYEVNVYSDGAKYWRLNGKLHREDGPAMEYASAVKEWYINGKRHRDDGPAIEYDNGIKEWYINGKRHREDGPAIEHDNGIKEWYLDGERYTENEFHKEIADRNNVNTSCENKVVEIDGKQYRLVSV